MNSEEVPQEGLLSAEKMDSHEIEKSEEAKLSAKYPNARQGVSSFLQSRGTRGQKFDSGEYQVAKQTGKSISSLLPFYAPFNLETPKVAAVREKRVLGPSKLATFSKQ